MLAELISLGLGCMFGLLVVFLYVSFSKETRFLSKKTADLLHHWYLIVALWPIAYLLEPYNTYAAMFLFGWGLVNLIEDASYHISDIVRRKKKLGELWE